MTLIISSAARVIMMLGSLHRRWPFRMTVLGKIPAIRSRHIGGVLPSPICGQDSFNLVVAILGQRACPFNESLFSFASAKESKDDRETEKKKWQQRGRKPRRHRSNELAVRDHVLDVGLALCRD